jgi:hypothetical protein
MYLCESFLLIAMPQSHPFSTMCPLTTLHNNYHLLSLCQALHTLLGLTVYGGYVVYFAEEENTVQRE